MTEPGAGEVGVRTVVSGVTRPTGSRGLALAMVRRRVPRGDSESRAGLVDARGVGLLTSPWGDRVGCISPAISGPRHGGGVHEPAGGAGGAPAGRDEL